MKVLDLRCSNGHGFEGWFGSEEDFLGQNSRGLIECPLCADRIVMRMPSAPRLNLSGAREPQPALQRADAPAQDTAAAPSPSAVSEVGTSRPPELQAAWMQAVRRLLTETEDVGERFAEEARRIHYGEAEHRGIRGKATPEQREALREEGIETFSLPVPAALDGPVQ
jgi:hypothetical protein